MFTRRQWLGGAAATAALAGYRGRVLGRVVEQRVVQNTFPGVSKLEGAGVRVNRIIGQPRLRHLDPFILLDQFHSTDPRDYIKGFPDHPHRGFETITLMLHGRVKHRDSFGNSGTISGGGVQWMTAGRGIVHSEMPERDNDLLSGFQFWLNLPAREKMRAPEYQDLRADQVPEVALSSGGKARLIAGRSFGRAGAVAERTTAPTMVNLQLEDDAPVRLSLGHDDTAFLFVHSGEVFVGKSVVREGHVAVLGPGNALELRAPTMRSGLVVAAAKAIGEPIVQRGPFVMNTMEEIRQAYHDYRTGQLAR